jgi:hypothetical protein
MPAHHDVRAKDVFTRRLHGTLAAAAERGPVDFADLLLNPGVGARTVRSLAMVAEVVHGAPYRFRDPARFSLAHGGKDRHPYSVPLKVYDETIRVMKSAVQNGKLGREEQFSALKRLDDQARLLERTAEGPSLGQQYRPGTPRLAQPWRTFGVWLGTGAGDQEGHRHLVERYCDSPPPARTNFATPFRQPMLAQALARVQAALIGQTCCHLERL